MQRARGGLFKEIRGFPRRLVFARLFVPAVSRVGERGGVSVLGQACAEHRSHMARPSCANHDLLGGGSFGMRKRCLVLLSRAISERSNGEGNDFRRTGDQTQLFVVLNVLGGPNTFEYSLSDPNT